LGPITKGFPHLLAGNHELAEIADHRFANSMSTSASQRSGAHQQTRCLPRSSPSAAISDEEEVAAGKSVREVDADGKVFYRSVKPEAPVR
jgi:hypothetical protein